MHFSDELIDDVDDGSRPFEGCLLGVLVCVPFWVLVAVWVF
jgi:hypothetical protein